MRISKNHEAYKEIKEALKNKIKDYTVCDDLQILKIANDFNLEIKTLIYSFEEDFKEDTKVLLEDLKNKALNTYEISNQAFESLSTKENHANIIALIKINNYTLNDLKNKEYLFILDSLEIPGNIGTIYRTLDSCSCDGVILVDSKTKMENYKIASSSRGCNLIIPTVSTSFDEALKFLLDNNYDIFLGEPELGLNYQQYDYKNKIAIVVGNERFGINPKWYDNKHKKVYIPMSGNQNSLNVGVAASILAYEAYMKRNSN